MSEIWKTIDGYPNYMVSNLGRIKSLNYRKTNKEEILTPFEIMGYQKINLYNKCRKQWYVHRIVAKHFPEICGEWFDGCEVDHINTITTDNCASNLRVVTSFENHNNPLTKTHMSMSKKGKTSWGKGLKYTTEHCENISKSLRGKYVLSKNPNAKSINQLTLTGEFLRKWDCIQDVVNTYGYKQPAISSCLTKRIKSAYGYKWEYVS